MPKIQVSMFTMQQRKTQNKENMVKMQRLVS